MDSKIRNITHNNQLYATIFDTKNIKEGLDFLTNDESFIQVGTWNYKKGKVLDAHFHNEFERKAFVWVTVRRIYEMLDLCQDPLPPLASKATVEED